MAIRSVLIATSLLASMASFPQASEGMPIPVEPAVASARGRLLRDGQCKGCDLRNAVLIEAHLIGVDLREADLRGADLQRANLEGADLTGAQLSRADLRGANLTNADLSDVDLRHADLSDAVVINAYAPGVRADGIRYVGADFTGSHLIYGGSN